MTVADPQLQVKYSYVAILPLYLLQFSLLKYTFCTQQNTKTYFHVFPSGHS